MRIPVGVPDDVGEEVTRRTDNVSAYVTDALTEKLEQERRRAARERIWEAAHESEESPAEDLHAINQRERREGDRDFSVEG